MPKLKIWTKFATNQKCLAFLYKYLVDVARSVIELSRVDTLPSSSSIRLLNSKLELDSNLIEFIFLKLELDLIK